MSVAVHLRRILLAILVGALLAPLVCAAQAAGAPGQQAPDGQNQDGQSQSNQNQARQNQKPVPLKPGIPGMGANHRLILKDGTYQMVRTYTILGDRVRFLSQERGDWEEIPASLVDWVATKKWEANHTSEPGEASPAMKEARELDKEEAAARADEQGRMPEVAKGLQLPDEDGVFVLDTFRGTPELVELVPTVIDMKTRSRFGLRAWNPLAGSRANIELDGAHARVHLHVNDPAIYLSLDTQEKDGAVTSHALVVNTGNVKDVANSRHGAHSASSSFAIVRVSQRRAVRIIGAIAVNSAGKVTPSDDVMPATVQALPGGHWLRVTPAQPLLIGEYALVEILSPDDINQTVWDFRVDPTLGDNPGSMSPILQ
ncbi:MAG TPA: hypothetical protein VFI20_11575 [Terracidiphilus sp.]|nr:hypothetical protein [Terracidiphilus sp.]